MPSEIPVNDPQNIWQKQPTEALKMSGDELRLRALKLQRKSRFEALYTAIACLLGFLWFGLGFFKVHQLGPIPLSPGSLWCVRMGFGVISLWGLYTAYRVSKGIWRSHSASDASLDTTLRSYRSQLEKRHDYERNVWRKTALPAVFVGIAMVTVPGLIAGFRISPWEIDRFVPLFVLALIWFVVFTYLRRRRLQKLELEIEQLRAFEREYQP